MDPEYAAKLGVNVNELLISQPDSGEEALNILESLVRSGMISVVVVDSVAALTPRAELEGEMGEQHVGRQARMMGQALRKLTAIAANSQTLIIFINQLRMKIGIMFGNPETTPGGRALPFAASVRIDIRRIAQVKKGEMVVGNRVKAKVAKNKVAPPFKSAEFDILFGEGISYTGDVLNAAVTHGVVKKSGSSFSYNGERLGVGFENSKTKLKEDKKLFEEIKKKTTEAYKNGDGATGEAIEKTRRKKNIPLPFDGNATQELTVKRERMFFYSLLNGFSGRITLKIKYRQNIPPRAIAMIATSVTMRIGMR